MIYELMNNEDFIEDSTSFICGLDLADEFVADVIDSEEEFFYEYTDEDIEDILNENEFFVCSRNVYEDGEVEYFIEPLIHNYGEQFGLETDVVLVQDELIDVVDFDKIEARELLSFDIIEEIEKIYEEEDSIDELLEEITEDILVDLVDEDNCPHCVIKEALETVWEMAYVEAMKDVADSLYEII